MDSLQMMLYLVCIPLILVICLLAALANIFVLLARLYVKSRSNSLELTFSLAASDTWTSIVVAASLFINSFMPVILGIPQSSLCFSLTLEVHSFFKIFAHLECCCALCKCSLKAMKRHKILFTRSSIFEIFRFIVSRNAYKKCNSYIPYLGQHVFD